MCRFLCQFEITCEINAWKYNEKSLYLTNCLTVDARSLLNELDSDARRDYNTLTEMVFLGLTALLDNISVYIGPSPKDREKEE